MFEFSHFPLLRIVSVELARVPDLRNYLRRNVIHGSDSVESARKLHFGSQKALLAGRAAFTPGYTGRCYSLLMMSAVLNLLCLLIISQTFRLPPCFKTKL